MNDLMNDQKMTLLLLLFLASHRLGVGFGFDPLLTTNPRAISCCAGFLPSERPVQRRPLALSATREKSGQDVETDDDEALLKTVTKDMLVDLCQQLQLPTKGAKADLLARLRHHAKQQIEQEKARRESYARHIEEGYGHNPKERYEMIQDEGAWNTLEDDEDEESDFFIFYSESTWSAKDVNNETSNANTLTDPIGSTKKIEESKKPAYLTPASVTAPPIPPDLEPNEDGERVVTIYSTTDQNDLTAITAAQPGQAANAQDLLQAAALSGVGGQNNGRPWEMDNANKKSRATNQEVEKATETVTELVQLLLALSGAPAFRALAEDSDHENNVASYSIPNSFVGFDPSQVPTNQLPSASKALRCGRGQVLEDVLRHFEIQAIGQDGMAGDNRDKGGGHYREVSKVRAFLEGFRRAEVRKMARETTTLLLDKLIQEGVEGLDITLASMTRSSDDTSDFAGELNDSLLDFLNDMIRQQEKKVELLTMQHVLEDGEETENQILAAKRDEDGLDLNLNNATGEAIDQLWSVTTEDGQRVESLDPNDPVVKQALVEELGKQETSLSMQQMSSPGLPDSAAEKLLLLLTLLRERLQAEAAYASDDKGRNLRLLAYCLRTTSEKDREQLLSRNLGSSLDVSIPSDFNLCALLTYRTSHHPV